MKTGIQLKVMLVTLLIAGAAFGPMVWSFGSFAPRAALFSSNSWRMGLLVLGIFNAVVEIPGTAIVRIVTVLVAGALLFSPPSVGFAVLIWFVWPPAYVGAWALADRSLNGRAEEENDVSGRRARVALASIIAAAAIASFTYRLLIAHNLQQTAALFIGIPSLIAIIVVLAVSPRSAIGVACKAVTVGLLVSGVFLQEGILCVVMSAPLFYAVAIVIVGFMQTARDNKSGSTIHSIAVLLVLPLTLEGVTPLTTVDRAESVTATRVVRASADDVEHALFAQPRFDRRLPVYLRAGFPMAVSTQIRQVGNGTDWVIRMRGGEMRLNGMEPREGDLILALQERGPGLLRWRVESDTSHMTHFLFWREVVVTWEPVTSTATRVTWTMRYDRGLDPAWYFGPMERYAVGLAAGYLIDSVATP